MHESTETAQAWRGHCGRGPCWMEDGHEGPCEPGGSNDPRRQTETAGIERIASDALDPILAEYVGTPIPRESIATLLDMAQRAVVAALVDRLPQVSTRRTDWGVRDDATGNVGTVGAYNRAATEEWLAELTEPSTLMRRERTTYRDYVTEWAPVEPSGNGTPPGASS